MIPLHLARVRDVELPDLEVKVDRLRAFIDGPRFDEVDAREQARLRKQYLIMCEYVGVLKERLEAVGV